MIIKRQFRKVGLLMLAVMFTASIIGDVAQADDYPKIYGGKTAAWQTGEPAVKGFSSEINYSETLMDIGSRTKAFITATERPLPAGFPLSPTIADCSASIDCFLTYTLDPANPVYYMYANAHPSMTYYSGRVTSGGETIDSDGAVVYPTKQILGDVYTGSAGKFDLFSFFGEHLHAGKDPKSNALWQVDGYEIDEKAIGYWDKDNFARNLEMRRNINRLINLGKTLGPRNPATDTTWQIATVNNDSPEGLIYYFPGDVTINQPITIIGGNKTLIIGKKLIINRGGQISADSTSKLGIIAMGGIDLNDQNGIDETKLVLFTPEKITIDRSLRYTGAMTANEFVIGQNAKVVKIMYDKSLQQSAPPGFNFVEGVSPQTAF